MKLELDLPADLFDAQYTADAFRDRVRELAVLELVRVKRLHEHEAQALLAIDRHELVARMRAAGIEPTESEFAAITRELDSAIAARRGPRARDSDKR
jgi:hypothetical protein